MNPRLEAIESRIAPLEIKMTEVDQHFAALEGKLNGLRSAGSVSDIGSSASTRAPRSIVPFVANWAEVKDFVISHKNEAGGLDS